MPSGYQIGIASFPGLECTDSFPLDQQYTPKEPKRATSLMGGRTAASARTVTQYVLYSER